MLGLASSDASIHSDFAPDAHAVFHPIVRPQPVSRRQRTELSPKTATDAELLERYRDEHEEEAFNELVARYAGELLRFLTRYLNGRVPAEDVLQNTLLQVHRKCTLFHDGSSVRAWLYGIATHQAIDALRRSRRSVRVRACLDPCRGADDDDGGGLIGCLAEEEPEPLDRLQAEERRQWVRDNVAALPERSRAVLCLAYYQGLKYQEIADALQVPLGTVKSRMHIAIARLREKAAG